VCTGPKKGAVRVSNARGCLVTVFGTFLVLSPSSPALSDWQLVELAGDATSQALRDVTELGQAFDPAAGEVGGARGSSQSR
jgi:hypothetical protein